MNKFEGKPLPTQITHASAFSFVSNILALPQTVFNDASLKIAVLCENDIVSKVTEQIVETIEEMQEREKRKKLSYCV